MLEVKKLSCGYKNKVVLQDISFITEAGEIVCILGSNGSGKTTLLKTIIGLLEPINGEVLVDNKNITKLTNRERAKLISYIPQVFSSMFQYNVLDIVLMGRTSYLPLGSSPSKEDEKIALGTMDSLRISHLKDKYYSKLSGGERQLVKIAQALTQDTKIIIMDEPTNNLDFGYQITMLNHLQKCTDMGITIIMATHFPEQVFLYGTKALLVKDNSVITVDKPDENLMETDLKELYGTELAVVELNLNNIKRKFCLPIC